MVLFMKGEVTWVEWVLNGKSEITYTVMVIE
jgi:hypothetical protein